MVMVVVVVVLVVLVVLVVVMVTVVLVMGGYGCAFDSSGCGGTGYPDPIGRDCFASGGNSSIGFSRSAGGNFGSCPAVSTASSSSSIPFSRSMAAVQLRESSAGPQSSWGSLQQGHS